MENEVLKAIKERRSIRRFKADQITDEELKTVLEAGTWAASIILPKMRLPSFTPFTLLSGARTMTMVGAP